MSSIMLLATLEESIQKWMDDQCEERSWPEVVIGEYTAFHMAKAAFSVLAAIDDAQAHGMREGLFNRD